jgi:zinc protease
MLKMKSLVIALFAFVSVNAALSQSSEVEKALQKPIPLDPKVKVGQLENGLTYYIRQNEKPRKSGISFGD